MSDTTFLTQTLATLELSLLAVSRIACGPEWAPPYAFSDPFNRLYWVREGGAWVEHHGWRYDLHPGVLTLIPANTSCRYVCPQAMVLDWTHFEAHVLHGIDLFSVLTVPYQVAVPDVAWMDGLWEDCLRHRREDGVGAILAQEAFLRHLLARVIDQYDAEAQDVDLRGIMQFREVLAFIEQRLPAPITLAELAEVANLHPTYFSNRFTKVMGEGPMTYINRRRIGLAKRLLRDAALPLKTVATAAGFCDEYYFSRIFKRLTHTTPGHFRATRGLDHP